MPLRLGFGFWIVGGWGWGRGGCGRGCEGCEFDFFGGGSLDYPVYVDTWEVNRVGGDGANWDYVLCLEVDWLLMITEKWSECGRYLDNC